MIMMSAAMTFNVAQLVQDRYAEGSFLPSVDSSQDWFLLNGEEENGYTILEFSRNLTTCDENDLNIQVPTSHILNVWCATTNIVLIVSTNAG